jgi:glycosyltransferase involved in cell wall biosynthesis
VNRSPEAAGSSVALPPLTYLTVDSIAEGVGNSQVVRYVERLALRGVDVTLHSFEQAAPTAELKQRLESAGVVWRPHRFRPGASAGLARVAQGAALIVRADLVHARSDMTAASAMLARRPAWVWDVRSFWREQRMALGMLEAGSPQERTMRLIEGAAARRSTSVVTLSQSAAEVLGTRFGPDVAAKSHVITTCVDLDRFSCSSPPPAPPVRFLLAGTLNLLYDVPCMLRLVRRMRSRCPAEITVLEPTPSPWEDDFKAAGTVPRRAEATAMPAEIAAHHIGLSVLRSDIGPSNRAATPTKIGEFLASGRPVVVNAGLGDMDELLARFDCGVVMPDNGDIGLDAAVEDLGRLLSDAGTPERCRALAEEHFNLDLGVDQLLVAYQQAVGAPPKALPRPPG